MTVDKRIHQRTIDNGRLKNCHIIWNNKKLKNDYNKFIVTFLMKQDNKDKCNFGENISMLPDVDEERYFIRLSGH